jgi:hypothetical protein
MNIEVIDVEEHEDGGSTITFKLSEDVRNALLQYALLDIIEKSCNEVLNNVSEKSDSFSDK